MDLNQHEPLSPRLNWQTPLDREIEEANRRIDDAERDYKENPTEAASDEIERRMNVCGELRAKRRVLTGRVTAPHFDPNNFVSIEAAAQAAVYGIRSNEEQGNYWQAKVDRIKLGFIPKRFRDRAWRRGTTTASSGHNMMRLFVLRSRFVGNPPTAHTHCARGVGRGRAPRISTSTRSRGSRRSATGSSSSSSDPGDGDPDPPGSTAHTGGRNQSLTTDRRCRS